MLLALGPFYANNRAGEPDDDLENDPGSHQGLHDRGLLHAPPPTLSQVRVVHDQQPETAHDVRPSVQRQQHWQKKQIKGACFDADPQKEPEYGDEKNQRTGQAGQSRQARRPARE